MNLLSKVLPLFFLPIGLTLILLVAGIATRRRALLIAATALLWICSMPLVGGRLARIVEGGFERMTAGDAPSADAIVPLSTGRVVAPGGAAISEWTDADRFFAGIDLYRAGKAPLVVFTGGWDPAEPRAPTEGEVLLSQAITMGVPADGVVTTGPVFNTAEEAAAVAALLRGRAAGAGRVILVTSAFHMPRATMLFTAAGLEVVPFPVDFTGRPGMVGLLDFLPSPGALGQTHRSLRELMGRAYYRMRALGI